MSTIERSLDWLERIGDRSNPILVKETRQALKSRQFVVTFMMLLAMSWLLLMFGLMLGGDALEYGAIGTQFFTLFFWILALAVLVIVPFGAYRSLLTEKDETTYDLLSITTLSPGQIVWGKLLSALVQVLIFYSAIAPFIAFTSLLQGFDFVTVAFKLVVTLLLSMLMVMGSIASSAMSRQRQWQGLSSLIVLGSLVFLMGVQLGYVEVFLMGFRPGDPEGWWVLGIIGAIAASYFVLFQQVAVSQLTFESDNRTTGVRLVCSGQLVLFWAALLLAEWLGPASFALNDEIVTVAGVLSLLHLGVVGLLAVTEDAYLSRRVRRNLPTSQFRRLLSMPFHHGGHRGLLYVLLHLGLVAVVVGSLITWNSSMGDEIDVLMALASYLMIYLGFAAVLGRWCLNLSPDIRPGHIRVLTLIVAAVMAIIPMAIQAFVRWGEFYRMDYTLLLLPNPMFTLTEISENGRDAGLALMLLGIGAALAVLVNVSAMRRGIAEVVLAEVPTEGRE